MSIYVTLWNDTTIRYFS